MSLLIRAASNNQEPNRCRMESMLHLRGEGEGRGLEHREGGTEGGWEEDLQCWEEENIGEEEKEETHRSESNIQKQERRQTCRYQTIVLLAALET